jgi:hypothetical protein
MSGAFAQFFAQGGLANKGLNQGQGYYRYYGTKDNKVDKEWNKHMGTFKEYYELLKQFDKYIMGEGTKKDPARTCRDLFDWYPFKESGNYWIDPSEGSADDAFLAFCNKTSMETCVYPKVDKFSQEELVFIGKDQYKWAVRDLKKEEGLEYATDIPQMKMLQLLSGHARQNVTYHCRNSFALRKPNDEVMLHPIKIMLDSEKEHLISKTTRKIRMFTIQDECHVKDHQWHKSVFEVKSKKSDNLPIYDIAAHDIGDKSEEFAIEVGPVCFS